MGMELLSIIWDSWRFIIGLITNIVGSVVIIKWLTKKWEEQK